jgi:hypothetical protein
MIALPLPFFYTLLRIALVYLLIDPGPGESRLAVTQYKLFRPRSVPDSSKLGVYACASGLPISFGNNRSIKRIVASAQTQTIAFQASTKRSFFAVQKSLSMTVSVVRTSVSLELPPLTVDAREDRVVVVWREL